MGPPTTGGRPQRLPHKRGREEDTVQVQSPSLVTKVAAPAPKRQNLPPLPYMTCLVVKQTGPNVQGLMPQTPEGDCRILKASGHLP